MFRSPVEPGSITLNWKVLGFLIPLLGIVGTWAVMQYQLREQAAKFADHEARLRHVEAVAFDDNAAVITRMAARQEDLLIDMAKVKARLDID